MLRSARVSAGNGRMATSDGPPLRQGPSACSTVAFSLFGGVGGGKHDDAGASSGRCSQLLRSTASGAVHLRASRRSPGTWLSTADAGLSLAKRSATDWRLNAPTTSRIAGSAPGGLTPAG